MDAERGGKAGSLAGISHGGSGYGRKEGWRLTACRSEPREATASEKVTEGGNGGREKA